MYEIEGYKKGVRAVEEKTCRRIKKILVFEKNGETLSVEVSLENVSPLVQKESLSDFLDALYQSAKKAIF